jgi:hypothetical protein
LTKVNSKKFDWGESEKPRLACPHCGPNYALIDDDRTLHQLGFVKVLSENPDEVYLLAEFGLCGNSHAWSDEISPDSRGVALVLESQYTPETGVVSLDEDEEVEQLMTPAQIGTDKKFQFKSSVSNALGDYLFELSPPYVVEPYISSQQREREQQAVGKVNRPNEWFECLWPFIKDSLDVKEGATIKENVLLIIYMQKTAEMRHTEPLWLFWKRFGMEKRALIRSLSSFPDELSAHLQELFVKTQRDYEPERSTIESLVNTLVLNKICPPMNGSEMQSFIQKATEFLGKMKKAPYGGLSCYEFLISQPLLSDSMTIGGQPLPHAGIIELVCIYAALRQKTSSADAFLRTVFPSEADPLWKVVLSEHGTKIGIERMINGLIAHIEKKTQ